MSAKKSKTSRKNSGSKIKYYDGQNFSCISCGKCCSLWNIPVTLEEKENIEKLPLPSLKNKSNFLPYHRNLFIIKMYDNRCAFLDNDNLCQIHKNCGEKFKPLACRLHPFDILNWKDGTVSATLKYDCPTVANFQGKPISKLKNEINSLANELAKKGKKASAVYNKVLAPEIAQLRCINNGYKKILLNNEMAPELKLFAAARLLEFHSVPKNEVDINNASDSFEIEAYSFIKRSIDDLRTDLDQPSSLKFDIKLILRYLISGYARVDEEVISRFLPLGRIGRVKDIVRFILAKGSLKDLSSSYPDTKGLDPLIVLTGLKAEKESINRYFHYLASKLYSMHFCGNAALKLTYVQGMRHLLLTYPVVFALAGMYAAVDQRTNIIPADVSQALVIVDHTFSRSPFFNLRHVKMMIKKLTSGKVFPAFLQINTKQ